MRLTVLHPCIRFPDPAFAVSHVVEGKPSIYFRDQYLPPILDGAYTVLDLAAVPPSRMAADSTVAAVVWDMDADRMRFFGWNPEASVWVEFEPVGFAQPDAVDPLRPVALPSTEPEEPARSPEVVESSPESYEPSTQPEEPARSPEVVEEPTEPAPVLEVVESSPEVVEDPNAPE